MVGDTALVLRTFKPYVRKISKSERRNFPFLSRAQKLVTTIRQQIVRSYVDSMLLGDTVYVSKPLPIDVVPPKVSNLIIEEKESRFKRFKKTLLNLFNRLISWRPF